MPGVLANLRARFGGARGHAASSIWGMAEYFAYPLMMFLATPLFLLWLGQVQYGQWMLLLTFNGLGGLAGLGMGSAAIRDVAAARGRDDAPGALAAVRACVSVTLLSGVAVAGLLLLFGAFAGGDLLARMGDPALIRTIIAVAALLILLEQLDTVFAGTLRGMERFDVSARVEALTKGGLVVAALLAAWATRDLMWVFAATAGMTMVRLCVKAGVASRMLGTLPWPSWDRPRMAAVFAFGKWTWAQALGAALFSTADRFLVGGLLGAEALARYSICLQLAQQVQTIPAAGAQFLFPAVSRRREAGEDYRRLAIRASLAIAAFGAAIGLPLALLAEPILRLWVGAEIAASSAGVLALLVLAFTILAANVGPFYVLLGSGRERFVALLNIGAGFVALGLLWLAINEAGLIGAAVGRIGFAAIISLSIVAFAAQLSKAAPDISLKNGT
jgi:O-antigen/teichoic acid export membrane protein